jgi:hypothetical protein
MWDTGVGALAVFFFAGIMERAATRAAIAAVEDYRQRLPGKSMAIDPGMLPQLSLGKPGSCARSDRARRELDLSPEPFSL